MTPEQAKRLYRATFEAAEDSVRDDPDEVYTYENPDGSMIQLLYSNGVVVTVEFADRVHPSSAA